MSTVALPARVAKSENELIDRVVKPLLALLKRTLWWSEDHFSSMLQDVVSEASALAAWDIAKKYHAKDMLVPVTAPHSAEASLALSPPLDSAAVPPRSSLEYGRVKLRRASSHGTRLVHSCQGARGVRVDISLLKTGCCMRPRRRACSLPLVLASDCATEPSDLMVLSIFRGCAVQVLTQS